MVARLPRGRLTMNRGLDMNLGLDVPDCSILSLFVNDCVSERAVSSALCL